MKLSHIGHIGYLSHSHIYLVQEEVYFPIREINLFRQKNMSNGIEFLSFKRPIPTVSLHLGPYLKGECMNQKAKPHKQSLVVEDQNDGFWVCAASSGRSSITMIKH